MATVLNHPLPAYLNNYKIASPGGVGQVGDAMVVPRLRTSCAALLPLRYDGELAKNELMNGSSIADGQTTNTTGGPARVYDTVWSSRQRQSIYGTRFENKIADSRAVEPIVIGTPQYSFKNMVASIVEAKRTGDKFLPLPGEYTPVNLIRGGAFPRVTDIAGDFIPAGAAGQPNVPPSQGGVPGKPEGDGSGAGEGCFSLMGGLGIRASGGACIPVSKPPVSKPPQEKPKDEYYDVGQACMKDDANNYYGRDCLTKPFWCRKELYKGNLVKKGTHLTNARDCEGVVGGNPPPPIGSGGSNLATKGCAGKKTCTLKRGGKGRKK